MKMELNSSLEWHYLSNFFTLKIDVGCSPEYSVYSIKCATIINIQL